MLGSRCTNLSKRNFKFIGKAGHRTSVNSKSKHRFLQYTFHHSKKERKIATRNKSETPQQVSLEKAFQNGHITKSHKSSEKRRLGNINRSDRCLFAHSNSRQSSQVSAISHKRPKLPVESNVLRSNICAKSLYKNNVSSHGVSALTKHTNSSISRRSSNPESIKNKLTKRSEKVHQSSSFTRFHYKCGKIKFGTKSSHSVLRNKLPSKCRFSQTNRRAYTKAAKSSMVNTRRSKSSNRFFAPSRHNCVLHRNYTKRTVVHEANTVTPFSILETKFSKFREKNSDHKSFKNASKLVVKQKQSVKRKDNSSKTGPGHCDNRCIKNRVWRSHELQNSPRRMVRGTKKLAHKSFRDGGSVSNSKTLPKVTSRSDSVDQKRQHNRGTIRKQTGRYQVPSAILQNVGSVELGNRTQHSVKSGPCSRKDQHTGRQTKSVQNITNRMDVEQSNSSKNFSHLGISPSGPVCIKSKQTDGHLLFMGQRSPSPGHRCTDIVMAKHVCVCIPPNMSYTKDSAAHEKISLSDISHSSFLAEETLVSDTTRNVDCGTNTSPKLGRSVDTAEVRDQSSRPQNIQTDGMAAINRHFEKRGFSEEAQSLLTASWRKGTQRDYTSKYAKFCSWCDSKQINPFAATLSHAIEFLTYLFKEGLQYRTIAGYRSMLSAVLEPVEGVSIGQHPLICRLIRGIFNTRPPKVKLLPEWDLPKVLNMLEKHPFEPLGKISLKLLTLKTIFLIAITSFRRCGDLQSLKLGEKSVNVQSRGVTFIRHGLAKQDRPSHFGEKVFIPVFKENKLLDPKRALYYYLKKTEKFRRGPDGSDQTSLFIATKEPHQPVSAQTISKWIVKVIKKAYEGKISKVKAHSTRAIGPSWAAYRGASVKSIMEMADWSRESTFIRFYLRDLDVPMLRK